MSKILFIGQFPPPLHGMSFVNSKLTDILKKTYQLTILPSNKIGDSGFLGKLIRLLYNLRTSYMIRYDFSIAYIPLQGNFGRALDIIALIFFKILNKKIIIHHHSYVGGIKISYLMKIIFFVTSKNSCHIFLTKKMQNDFKRNYRINHSLTLSNALFVECQPFINSNPSIKRKINIGLLSNLTYAKGTQTFLSLIDSLYIQKIKFHAYLAGPCEDLELQNLINYYQTKYKGSFTYIGMADNEEKKIFYKSIDLFVFPTRYENEAEPLVIIESLSYSVPVIANNIGSLSTLINKKNGLLISRDNDFILDTMDFICKYRFKNEKYKNDTYASFLKLKARSKLEFKKITQCIK